MQLLVVGGTTIGTVICGILCSLVMVVTLLILMSKSRFETTNAMRRSVITRGQTTDGKTTEMTIGMTDAKTNAMIGSATHLQEITVTTDVGETIRINANNHSDNRRHHHNNDIGPCHNRRVPSPPWTSDREQRRSTTPNQEEFNGIKAYVPELRIARWPKGLNLVSIEKYNGQTNPREWLQLYSTANRSAGGDSFVMANYLPVRLEPAIQIWLTSLSEKSITSWGDLNQKFIESFQATCNRPGNHFDLTWIKQKADKPLRDYIKRFCAKKTEIPNVLDQQIIATFQEGVQSDELVHEIG
ncbi:hypothetical protein PR202_gb23663 [Eleusine coracana subsp. coracana]|uniref:Retrotransposon gag domain-containing protein n=1 Tax=Eleusine coracana subsp. coracana TaxID=191504 RepID=A0AAV5FIS7_ELECO|nr:hypothetical protein PR202_gb23663 [Eleusine coracana subsp. coracana]